MQVNDIICKLTSAYEQYYESGNQNQLERAIHEQQLVAKTYKLKMPSLEEIERKTIIKKAKEVFIKIEKIREDKLNVEEIKRMQQVLSRLRVSASKLGISLDREYKKVKEKKHISELFDDDRVDIHNAKINDPITEEFCEGFLKSVLATSQIESRFIRLDSTREREQDEPNTSKISELSKNVMIDGLKIVIAKIKSNNFDGLNENYVRSILEVGIENIEEYLNSGTFVNEKVKNFVSNQLKNNYNFVEEHVGSYSQTYPFKPNDTDKRSSNQSAIYSYRIYLNTPRTNRTMEFIREYCLECQKQGIDFNMKLFFNNSQKNLDRTILYSTYGDVNKRISILKSLLEKYKDIHFGSPPPSCVKIDGIETLGICQIGMCNANYYNIVTYNDYINTLFKLSFGRMIDSYGYSSRFSKKFQDVLEKYKKGETTGVSFNNPEDMQTLCSIIKEILTDERLKANILSQLCDYVHQEHNKINGYSIMDKKNIALDTWYIDEQGEKYLDKSLNSEFKT